MTSTQSGTRFVPTLRLATSLFVLAPLAAAILAGCGGSGTGDVTGSGANQQGAQSVSEGTMTGFGSVFVNGNEYDISTATITDEFGNVVTEDALKLGMHVEVTGTDPTTGSSGEGSAGTVTYTSDIEGPVSAVDVTAGTITILDQTIDANPNTVWDPALVGQLAGLTVGEVVKIYSLYDGATNEYVSTRVEADSGATRYKIRGAISNLDTTAMTYTIGSLPIDYSTATGVPGSLADGVIATAELQTVEGQNAWMATGIQVRKDGLPGNKVNIHVRGLIASESNATFFVLDGWPVDASAANFVDGQGVVVPGAAVQVDGIMSNGSLVATTVKLQKTGEQFDFQVHGAITSVDQAAQTFILRGQTVSYAGNVTYANGDVTGIVIGAKAFVQGSLAVDGSTVDASTIKYTSN